ncbi:MAG: hypothetical protein IPM32_12065 [Ignavibacteriae bacterium]|nr:hypothetical protein [Ignavibacteriota bacterium]
MNSEIVIVQEKLALVMQTVQKIIKALFHSTPILMDFQNINYDETNTFTKIIILDQTIFDKNFNLIIGKLKLNFPNASFIIATLDNSQFLENLISQIESVELLNLWNTNNSITKQIISCIGNKVNFGTATL